MACFSAKARVVVAVGFVGFAVACGGGEGDPAGDGDGDDGSGGSAQGATGGSSGEGTGGSGETGGTSSGNVEPPTSRPSVTCESDVVTYEGTVGGVPVDETLTLGHFPVGQLSVVGFDGGAQIMATPDDRAEGLIAFPEGSQHVGKVWCIDDGLAPLDTGTGFSYIGHLLGSCPGTPTEDTAYACHDSGFTFVCDDAGPIEDRRLGGTLNGTEIAVLEEDGFLGFTSGVGDSYAVDTGAYQYVVFSEAVPNGGSGPVRGLIRGGPGSAHEGQVFCIDSGTLTKSEDGELSRFVLDGISYLGNCNDAGPTEKLEGCVGFD